jgi:hypothetical protein
MLRTSRTVEINMKKPWRLMTRLETGHAVPVTFINGQKYFPKGAKLNKQSTTDARFELFWYHDMSFSPRISEYY